jgi:glycosyltransferase involved in cell wall biosynthesis
VRICYLANAASIHIVRWVKYFASKGHEVHLISPGISGENAVESVNLHLLPMSRRPILRFYPIRIRRLLRKIEPDILHAHYVLGYGLWGALSGFHPFILSVWGSDVLAAPKSSRLASLEVKFALRKVDMVTAQNEAMGDYLRNEFKLPQSKFVRIPWGIDLTVFHPGYEADVIKLKNDLGISENSSMMQFPMSSIIAPTPYLFSCEDMERRSLKMK